MIFMIYGIIIVINRCVFAELLIGKSHALFPGIFWEKKSNINILKLKKHLINLRLFVRNVELQMKLSGQDLKVYLSIQI